MLPSSHVTSPSKALRAAFKHLGVVRRVPARSLNHITRNYAINARFELCGSSQFSRIIGLAPSSTGSRGSQLLSNRRCPPGAAPALFKTEEDATMRIRTLACLTTVLLTAFPIVAAAEEDGSTSMTPQRMGEPVLRVDSEAVSARTRHRLHGSSLLCSHSSLSGARFSFGRGARAWISVATVARHER